MISNCLWCCCWGSCGLGGRHVTFEYTVSAENRFDGLSFYIDSTVTPVMTLESSKVSTPLPLLFT